ncbi:chemotaxis protein CheW [Paeniroseomonas aquatica]
MGTAAAGVTATEVLCFRVAAETLALPAAEVAEIIRLRPVTRLPQGPASLLGLIALRGGILPVVSLAGLLGLAQAAATPAARIIVLQRGQRVGLLVDAVAGLAPAAGQRRLELAPLLARDFAQALRRAEAPPPAPTAAPAAAPEQALALLGFTLAGQHYALPLERVLEVARMPAEVTGLPAADAAMTGVMQRRGGLLPLVSLRALLGLPAPDRREARIIVARLGGRPGGHRVGLVVDALQAIWRVPGEAVEPVPAVLTRGAGEARIEAIVRHDGGRRLVSILSTEGLFDPATAARLLTGPDQDAHAMTSEDGTAEGQQFILFRLGAEHYGLPVATVDEVIRHPCPHPGAAGAGLPAGGDDPARPGGAGHRPAPALRGRRPGRRPRPHHRRHRRRAAGRLRGGCRQRAAPHRGRRDRAGARAGRRGRRPGLRPRRHPRRGWPHGAADRAPGAARPGGARPAGRHRRRRARRVIRLLVVDDSALMRRLLATVFAGEADFTLAFARDGLEALACLAEFRPDVITLDIHMPRLDGLACLDRIMLERPCPVVMVSAMTEAGADATLEAMQLGAVDFIAKPAGAISLAIDELGPLLVRKVRAAAQARLRRSLRLAERVRHAVAPLVRETVAPLVRQGVPPPGAARAAEPRPQPQPQPQALPQPLPRPQAAPDRVVLVGTSTGGPPALDALLSPLPADFPWPILVAQHMPAVFTGPLARRLDRLCALTVEEVVRPQPLRPGHVYIGRGDADIVLAMRPGGPVVQAAPRCRAIPGIPASTGW